VADVSTFGQQYIDICRVLVASEHRILPLTAQANTSALEKVDGRRETPERDEA
jgi:hypothetical protein